MTKYLDEAGKSYYTYQLKSAKGLQVVIKGIESSVTSTKKYRGTKGEELQRQNGDQHSQQEQRAAARRTGDIESEKNKN